MARTDPETRRTGAHFLAADSPTVQRLVEAAGLRPGETALDVGAGKGAITKPLAEAVAPGRVLAVERDARRAEGLARLGLPGVEVLRGDVLAMDLPRVDAVVANPPFGIAPAILRKLLRTGFGRAILVVPQELADRLTAEPHTGAYGKLTVQMGLLAKTAWLFNVPRRAFDPPPEVAACAVRMVLKPPPQGDLALLDLILDAAWEQRKRTLRHSLAPLAGALGLPPQDVSETLEMCSMTDRTFADVSPWEYGNFAARLAEARERRRATGLPSRRPS